MVDFLRYWIGIFLWTFFAQLPLLASELPKVDRTVILTADDFSSSSPQNSVTSLTSLSKFQSPTYVITQERQGEVQKFEIPANTDSEFNPSIPIDEIEVVEVIADSQEYDEQRQVITAEGNVVMRFAQSVMTSDRLEVNLKDNLAVAEGNVVLTRGEQVLRGEKFEYYLVTDRGVIFNAGGEIYQPSLSQDLDFEQKLAPEQTVFDQTLSERLTNNQPLTEVTSNEGIGATFGSSRDVGKLADSNTVGGNINRLRFQADRVDFETSTWEAKNLRLTNDPFSPPELELRANTATFQQDDLASRLVTTKSRLVIDDSFTVPLLASTFVFDGQPSKPGLFNIGFDGDDRGGLFIERSFNIINGERVSWEITPQYFLQRALFPTTFRFSESDEGGIFDPAVFGLKSKLETVFTRRTKAEANFSLTSFDFEDFEDNFRAKVGIRQQVGRLDNPYNFDLEYNFRDRLFNGSLGFQTVFNSIGAVVTSPNIAIADTGINLTYQASIQNINADTDRQDLLATERDNNRVNLTRYQGAVFLKKSFSLWSGKALPATKDQGLRYTPVPVVPYLRLFTGVSGVTSFYSNSDTQLSLQGDIGIQGQLGHFSRSWLDYTGFRISYSQNIRGDESPFLFDRLVDRQILSLGVTQQIYGPIRLGVQTSLDLNDNDEISTDYLLEYSRRTHNVSLRYNPVLELGSISLQISDFNWRGNPRPFEDNEVTPVIQGVGR